MYGPGRSRSMSATIKSGSVFVLRSSLPLLVAPSSLVSSVPTSGRVDCLRFIGTGRPAPALVPRAGACPVVLCSPDGLPRPLLGAEVVVGGPPSTMPLSVWSSLFSEMSDSFRSGLAACSDFRTGGPTVRVEVISGRDLAGTAGRPLLGMVAGPGCLSAGAGSLMISTCPWMTCGGLGGRRAAAGSGGFRCC